MSRLTDKILVGCLVLIAVSFALIMVLCAAEVARLFIGGLPLFSAEPAQ